EVARLLGLAPERVRVIAPDVGGGFGVKGGPYREEVLIPWLARRLGRPVKWISTRVEDLLTTHHGRGAAARGELAVAADGAILGLRARIVCPLGPSVGYTALGTPRNYVRCLPGPFATATGQSYDSGDYPALLARVLAAADYAALRRAQAERRARGELVGVGLSVYVEPSGLGWESGLVRVEADGRVTAATGSSAHGQGHETVFAQIVADRLGVEPEAIEVRHGDTAAIGRGIGTFGSRSTALGGGALVHAAEAVVAKARRLAGHLLEAHAEDVRLAAGGFAVAGFAVAGVPDRFVRWADVARLAWRGPVPAGEEPGLEASHVLAPEHEVWSGGAVVAAVRVERETGHFVLERLVWIDDAGTIINPLLADGQLDGSLAQAWGQIAMEAVRFDAEGHLLSGTLMDYAVPRADDVPRAEVHHAHSPTPRNP